MGTSGGVLGWGLPGLRPPAPHAGAPYAHLDNCITCVQPWEATFPARAQPCDDMSAGTLQWGDERRDWAIGRSLPRLMLAR